MSAEAGKIERLIREIALSLAMLDFADIPAVAATHTLLENLRDSLRSGGSPLAETAEQCATLVQKLIFQELPDSVAAQKSLHAAIDALQAVVCNGRTIDSVSFPKELSPGSALPSASSKKKRAASAKVEACDAVIPSAAGQETFAPSKMTQPEASLEMSLAGADSSIVAEFFSEARDHCAAAEQNMMNLESGEDYDSSINAIFRSFHTIKGAAGFLALHPISVLAHEAETLLDLARKGSRRISGVSADIVFESIDGLRKLLTLAEQLTDRGGSANGAAIVTPLVERIRQVIADPGAVLAPDRIGDILTDMGAATRQEIEAGLRGQETKNERSGELLVRQGIVPAQAVAHALKDQQHNRQQGPSAVRELVRIDTERLDRLLDTIGELVIAESMVSQDDEIMQIGSTRTAKNLTHLNKVTRELQQMGMSMRLVPVKNTFQKLSRAVRDLSRKAGKQIELIPVGEDAEVDRSIVEAIGDPLMHMIRNACDHAVETPAERIAAGKEETGHIWLRALQRGGTIQFEIEDDGRGLNAARILAKAAEKGLVDGTRQLTDREIFSLILLPGFSTATHVTDISGRGVGMDVVKRNIEAMRGQLDIMSTPGQGTRFTMKVPLTLAMIDGMLIRVAEERLILPTTSVLESLHLTDGMIRTVHGAQEIINLRGRILPVLHLRQLLALHGTRREGTQVVVVVEENGERVGLVADELIGQRQTVIKNLGAMFAGQKWAAGGAIMSDGTVGLIADISGLIALSTPRGNSPEGASVRSRMLPALTQANEDGVSVGEAERFMVFA